MFRSALNLTILLLGLSAVACSHQWSEPNPNVSPTNLQAVVSDAFSSDSVGDSGAAIAQASAILQDHAATTIYFNDSSRSKTRAAPAMSATSLNFLLPPEALRWGAVKSSRVLYIEHEGDHQAVLIVGVEQSGAPSKAGATAISTKFYYYSFQGQGVIKDGVYSMQFTGADGNPVTLRSYDVKANSLRATIQFRAYSHVHGQDVEVADFASLTGYR